INPKIFGPFAYRRLGERWRTLGGDILGRSRGFGNRFRRVSVRDGIGRRHSRAPATTLWRARIPGPVAHSHRLPRPIVTRGGDLLGLSGGFGNGVGRVSVRDGIGRRHSREPATTLWRARIPGPVAH